MTIFESIRYPVRDLPKEEELDAIPVHILDKWIVANDFYEVDTCAIHYYLRHHYYHSKKSNYVDFKCMSAVIDLRKRIAEYEPV